MKPRICLLMIIGLLAGLHQAAAQTWTQTSAPTNDWEAVASSADGSKLVAAARIAGSFAAGPIYTSTNSGITWIQTSAPSNLWKSVASSADGNKLVAAGSDPTFSQGVIFISTNSGTSWTQASAPNIGRYCPSIAMSADGTKLAVIGEYASFTNSIDTSTNSGITWTQTSAPSTNWNAIASSADGTKLVAMVNELTVISSNMYIGGLICVSTNSGATWVQTVAMTNSAAGWWWVASSADGTKLAAVDLNHVFTSVDSGMTWTQTSAPFAEWSFIASSADGKK
jgi:hypothetical protein